MLRVNIYIYRKTVSVRSPSRLVFSDAFFVETSREANSCLHTHNPRRWCQTRPKQCVTYLDEQENYIYTDHQRRRAFAVKQAQWGLAVHVQHKTVKSSHEKTKKDIYIWDVVSMPILDTLHKKEDGKRLSSLFLATAMTLLHRLHSIDIDSVLLHIYLWHTYIYLIKTELWIVLRRLFAFFHVFCLNALLQLIISNTHWNDMTQDGFYRI